MTWVPHGAMLGLASLVAVRIAGGVRDVGGGVGLDGEKCFESADCSEPLLCVAIAGVHFKGQGIRPLPAVLPIELASRMMYDEAKVSLDGLRGVGSCRERGTRDEGARWQCKGACRDVSAPWGDGGQTLAGALGLERAAWSDCSAKAARCPRGFACEPFAGSRFCVAPHFLGSWARAAHACAGAAAVDSSAGGWRMGLGLLLPRGGRRCPAAADGRELRCYRQPGQGAEGENGRCFVPKGKPCADSAEPCRPGTWCSAGTCQAVEGTDP